MTLDPNLTNSFEELQSLISLTQLYLKETCKKSGKIRTDSDTYHFYKAYAGKQNKKALPSPEKNQHCAQQAPTPSFTNPPKPSSIPSKPISKPIPEPVTPTPPKDITPQHAPLLTPSPKVPTLSFGDFSDFQKTLKEKFPAQKIIETIPGPLPFSAPPSTPQAYILTTNETPEELSFLKKIGDAITSHFCPTSLTSLETFNPPSTPHLILGNEEVLKTCSFPSKTLISLQPLSLYTTQPQLKAALWQQIKNAF